MVKYPELFHQEKEKNIMWTLKQLQDTEEDQACINDKWVPARPENYKKCCMSLRKRIKYAWEVFMCRAEAFTWPEGQ